MKITVAVTPAGVFLGKQRITSEFKDGDVTLADPARLDLVPMGIPGRVPENVQVMTLRNVSTLGIHELTIFSRHLIGVSGYDVKEADDGGQVEAPPALVTLYFQALENEAAAQAEQKHPRRVKLH